METFRVGCIGQLGERGMVGAVEAIGQVLAQMREAA
jgi:aspartate aminotransferase-like enzyme